MFKRLSLFLATNLAVLVLAGVVLNVVLPMFGIRVGNGSGNAGLLVMAAVFGFGGAFFSLAISKWMAKRSTGMQLITEPRNDGERWLLETVRRQAERAGVRQIVYLGGLGEDQLQLSAHLRSRMETAAVLTSGAVPVTTLRAAVIVGRGSAAFETIVALVDRLPVMIAVFRPITSPAMSTSGPPEFPGLIGASVWM